MNSNLEFEHKAYWALKHCNYDLLTAGDHRKVQLNELNKLRDQDFENSLIYKEKTKRIHDSKIQDRVFNVGDRVLLFDSRLKIFSGKLKTRWSGPFTITQVFPYGTVELSQTDGPNFKQKLTNYPLDHIREDLSLVEEPKKILDRQERVMRNKTIPYVKILWKNHPEREATWETKESMRTSYPRFFSGF
nr:reverse transcriptase domain-containing protein [Tanacetum cinerariifolium]